MPMTMIILTMLSFALLGMALMARTIWTVLLGILAGLGLACADGKAGRNTSALGSYPYATCYDPFVIRHFMTSPNWQGIDELEAWASAERAILGFAHSDNTAYDQLQALIDKAEMAASAARPLTEQGIVSSETYILAVAILQAWHRDVALANTSIRCYEAVIVQPLISDVTMQLETLDGLMREGKLSQPAAEQARQTMRSRIQETKSPQVAKELSQLLVQMLGYN